MIDLHSIFDGAYQLAADFYQNYLQTPLTRQDLLIAIKNKSDLSGATLAEGVNVVGLQFVSVRMDKAMLQLLIEKGAGVKGVDLTNQVLAHMDLTDVDLTDAICTGTNFSGVQLCRTNLTGVSLNSALFSGETYIESVIVSDEDRFPYVQDLFWKLMFILKGDRGGENGDAFYKLPTDVIQVLRQKILFTLSERSLKYARTQKDGGAQDIFFQGRFDARQINKDGLEEDHIVQLAAHATAKLTTIERGVEQGEEQQGIEVVEVAEFTEAQKTLFHYARSAMWQLVHLNKTVYFSVEEKNQEVHFSNEENELNDMAKKEVMKEIYIMGGHNQRRVTIPLLDICYYAVLPFVQERYPEITGEQTREVYVFFTSPHYSW